MNENTQKIIKEMERNGKDCIYIINYLLGIVEEQECLEYLLWLGKDEKFIKDIMKYDFGLDPEIIDSLHVAVTV